MEPIGTITMYFPFLDDESREIMQNIMDEAYNYHDFAQRLKERVLEGESPDLVVYFAIHHSAGIFDMDAIESIARIYGKMPILRPNIFYARVHQGNPEDAAKVHESADEVIASNPPEWMQIEMRLLKFEVDLLQYPKILYDTSNLDAVKEIIESSPKYEFYLNMLYDYLREKAARDGDSEEAIRCLERAITYGEKCDDIVRLAYFLRRKAGYLQATNIVEAKNLLLRALDIMGSLGTKAGFSSILYYLSRLEAIRGEYNLAIERNLEVVSIREKAHLPTGVYSAMLATLYNVVRDPESGLEWARMAETDFESHPAIKPRALLNKAWSLILLQKRDEALEIIDSVRESILKSGLEILLGWLSFISGIYEMSEGDFAAASKSFEDALGIMEKQERLEFAVIILHHLAKLGVQEALASSEDPLSVGDITWLRLLEEKATSDNLPGILGQAHLLKAKIAIAYVDNMALQESIKQISLLGRKPSVDFLNEELTQLLERT